MEEGDQTSPFWVTCPRSKSPFINVMLCMNLFILCELAVDLAVCVCVCVRSDVTLKNKYDCSSELKT